MENRKEVIKKIEDNKKEIKAQGVKKIGLFGSYLKDNQNKKSDIDILVKFDYPDFEKYAELLILLEKIFKKKIDLVTESSLRPELKYVLKEAKYVAI
jgi:uncharacterized protein